MRTAMRSATATTRSFAMRTGDTWERAAHELNQSCSLPSPINQPVTHISPSSLQTSGRTTLPRRILRNSYSFQFTIFSMNLGDVLKGLKNHQSRRRPKGGTYKCQNCRNFFKAERKICPLCGSTSTHADSCSDCRILLADGRTQPCPRCESTATVLVE